jgi:hypothetical protein
MTVSARIFASPGPDGNFHARLEYTERTAARKTAQEAADAIVSRFYGPDRVAVFVYFDPLTKKRTYRIEDK